MNDKVRTGSAPAIPIERSLSLQNRLTSTRQTLGYQTAYFKEVFSDELWQAMKHRGLTQAQFAERANLPKQYLTKIFKGGNCTCDTIVKLAYALGYNVHVHLTPKEVGCGNAENLTGENGENGEKRTTLSSDARHALRGRRATPRQS